MFIVLLGHLLGKLDQSEINRIIAEASKGSKFYENEKKKDKVLTERIERILNYRDDAVKGVDIKKLEMSVDRLIAELESQRDLSQTIVHVDMDAFFANVELLHNPELRGKPFGVGRGVLTTASYEARKYGVRSGMPGFIAKKLCPDLILVSNHFSRYSDMSDSVMSIFRRYDPNMSPAGCDEGYLNITQYCQNRNLSSSECVEEMRRVVFEETKLTVSAGIAPNKMLAKICSDKNKPNGQFELVSESKAIISFMHDLSIRKIPGIGRVNERLLESVGIKTCGDILTHRAVISLMDKWLGMRFLLNTYLGISSNVVRPYHREERKSIGAERTFSPLADTNKILRKLDEVATELEKDMIENGWTGRTVTLKYKLDTFQVFTRAQSFDRWIKTREELYTTGKDLLLAETPLNLRLIGLRVTKLKDLKAPAPSGIKRFFEPLQEGSPRKRPKLEGDENEHGAEMDDSGDFESHAEEAMPGFYEHEDEDIDEHDDDSDLVNPQLPPPPKLPPSSESRVSDVAKTSTSSANKARLNAKPHSTSTAVRPKCSTPSSGPARNSGFEWLTCPVCEKAFQTDNEGLNSHIDFCLSRGAIRQAHAEASSTLKKSSRTGQGKESTAGNSP